MTEKHTPEKVAELVAELEGFAAGSESARATLMRDAADALTAVSAERDAEHGRAESGWKTAREANRAAVKAMDERDRLADALTAVSAERSEAERVADVRRQTIAAYERENAAWELQFHVAERERDRLHKAITEVLDEFERLEEACVSVPSKKFFLRILRAALDREGSET